MASALTDLFHGEEALRDRIAARLVPPSVAHAAAEATASVEGSLDACARELDRLRPDARAKRPTAACARSATSSAKSSVRPGAKCCAATSAPPATRRRSTA